MRIKCACGCGATLTDRDERGRARRFVIGGHAWRGRARPEKANPHSKSARTGRCRARKMTDTTRCALERIGGCSNRIEVHHIDGDPMNNAQDNRIALCGSHHRLVEHDRIDLAAPVMPRFFVSSGKRRYRWSSKA